MADARRAALATAAGGLRFLKALYVDEEPEGWDKLPDELVGALLNAEPKSRYSYGAYTNRPLGRNTWRIMSSKNRQQLLDRVGTSQPIPSLLVDIATNNGEMVAVEQISFSKNSFFDALLRVDPMKKEEALRTNEDYQFVTQNLDLAHLRFRYAAEYEKGYMPSSGKKRSATALDLANVIPSKVDILKTSKLQSKHVHYGMFWGLDSEKFWRFDLPSTLDSLLDKLEDATKKDINKIVDESTVLLEGMPVDLSASGALEPQTQFGFQLVFRRMVKQLCETGVLPEKKLCVKPVNGMTPVEFKQTIRKEYWDSYLERKKNELNKKEPKNKSWTAATTREKTVAVESDLVLWDEKEALVLGMGPGSEKKEMFLRTPLKIEMKRIGLLTSNMNRSELTQLALQSLARKEGRRQGRQEATGMHKSKFDPEEQVFSILTDCTTLYVLCHHVNNGTYWMSRGITEPSEKAVALCWLVLVTSGASNMAASFKSSWKCAEKVKHVDTVSDPSDVSVGPSGLSADEQDHGPILLPNGRWPEEQEILDRLALRFSEYMGHYDTAALAAPRVPLQEVAPLEESTSVVRFSPSSLK